MDKQNIDEVVERFAGYAAQRLKGRIAHRG